MAQSRLEKVGNIYTRVASLMKAGAMAEENKPLWFNLYKVFPPKYEPKYDRPGLTTPVKQIFYKEDKIRARFHSEYKYFSMVNMIDTYHVSRTEQFLLIYKQLEREGIPEAELYDKAIQEFLSKVKDDKIEKEMRNEKIEATEATQSSRPVKKQKPTIDLKNLFDTEDNEAKEDLKQYKPIRLSMDKFFEKEKEDESKKSD